MNIDYRQGWKERIYKHTTEKELFVQEVYDVCECWYVCVHA